jgi:Rrf2 family protein
MKNIINLSEAFNIGLHAMVMLAADTEKKYSVKTLAKEINSSEAHLSKVMQRFSRSDVVSSVSGPNGGFSIIIDPAKITILEIYEIIDGKFPTCTCLLNFKTCARHKCIMGELVNKVNKDVFEYFSKTKLIDII